MIRTVLCDQLGADGHFQCHEHLFLARGRSFEINRSLCMDDYGASLTELRRYRAAGGAGIVDAQPGGCGRIADALIRASRESGVQIVASTGFHKLVFYPEGHWIFRMGEAELAELWVSEIERGMFSRMDDGEPRERLPGRAGVIKVAVDGGGVAGRCEMLFSAAAEACLRTGAPLLCHVELGVDPMRILAFLDERGVSPGRVILCHLDRANPDMAVEAAEAGAFIEFDTIARWKYHSNEDEARQILRLVARGHADRLLLSLDTTNQRLTSYGGEIGLCYLLNDFFPFLLARGLDRDALWRIANANPGDALAIRSRNEG